MWVINSLIFLAVISVLIISHEFGHFLVARLSGINVEKFAIGFGPIIFKKKIRETLFLICAIPLGGYVKLRGDSRDDCQGRSDEFFSKSPGIRARVVFAGPLFNYFCSFLILWFLFTFGMPFLDTTIGELIKDSPGEIVGLQEQDKIIEINGQRVDTWEDMQYLIRKSKNSINLLVLRNDQILEFRITPETKKLKDIFGREREFPIIGIKSALKVKILKDNFFVAFFKGFKRLIIITLLIVKGLYYTVTGVLPVRESVAGPIALFQITSDIAQQGFVALLNLISIIGVSLALINLFPIPVLDGGHLLFFLLEKIRKKPLSQKSEDILNRLGIIIIGLVVVFVFYNDILRIVSK